MQQLMQHPGGLSTNARNKISYPCGVLSGIRSSHLENSFDNFSSFDSWETRGELLARGHFQPMAANSCSHYRHGCIQLSQPRRNGWKYQLGASADAAAAAEASKNAWRPPPASRRFDRAASGAQRNFFRKKYLDSHFDNELDRT